MVPFVILTLMSGLIRLDFNEPMSFLAFGGRFQVVCPDGSFLLISQTVIFHFDPKGKLLHRLGGKGAYPEVVASIIVYDPEGAFSTVNPDVPSTLRQRLQFTGPIYFDRDGWLKQIYNTPARSRIFVFNKQGQLLTILLPSEDSEQRNRFALYFDLARNHIP